MASRRSILPLVLAGLGLAAGSALLASPGDVTRVSLLDASGVSGGNAPAQGAAVSADGRFVAFTSTAKLTAADPGGKRQLYVRDRQTGRTVLASASAAGVPANLDVAQDPPGVPFAISGNGRYVVFSSDANDLVPGDANTTDVFRKDLATGAIALVDVNGQGQQANAAVLGDPDISADGNRVAYVTGAATNLFPGDVDNQPDVVLRDMSVNTSTLVSQSTAGALANGPTGRPAISADGRVVSFDGGASTTNLVPGQQPGEILVRDVGAGTTVRATVATDGSTPSPAGADLSDISGDGRYVVFQSSASYDPANDTNTAVDVYRRDLATETTTLVSARNGLASASGAGDSVLPAVSADGSRVLFQSSAADLVAGDTNAVSDAFVRDVPAAATTRVSTGPGGVQALNPSTRAGLSANGGLAAFDYTDTSGQPLLAGDTNLQEDVFARELVPSDSTPPPIAIAAPADGAAGPDQEVTVSGTVGPDPSGVVGATLNGAPLTLGPGGAFGATLSLGVGPTALTVSATDGAGNTATATATVTRTLPAGPVAAPPARLPVRPTKLVYSLKKRRLVVRFRLPAPARVRVELFRVTPRPKTKPVRYSYARVGRLVNRALGAGQRSVTLVIPLLKPARYQLRVSTVAPGGLAQAVRVIVVSPPKKKATGR